MYRRLLNRWVGMRSLKENEKIWIGRANEHAEYNAGQGSRGETGKDLLVVLTDIVEKSKQEHGRAVSSC